MEAEFQEKAEGILTLEQHSKGAVPEPWTALKVTDTLTIIGLTALGIMLVLGLFSRFTCLVAAFMLFNFYMAMPPWPGTPPAPGPEHSFIINKTLIEAIALLALATIPTGRWFGLDCLLSFFFQSWRTDSKKTKAKKSTVEVEASAEKTGKAAN